MTAGTFHDCAMGWVVRRAVVSTGPPGGKGTMNVTGLSGQFCAADPALNSMAHADANPASKARETLVLILLID